MATNFTKSWQAEVGINHVPAYQVSGRPYATGNINASSTTSVTFPYVTRWFQVINKTSTPLKVGFSELGVDGTNYFTVDASGSAGYGVSEPLEIKITQLWLNGGNGVDVVAGLTTVPAQRTETSTGPSWSGSLGVG